MDEALADASYPSSMQDAPQLLSAEQLAQHARSIATRPGSMHIKASRSLLRVLDEHQRVIASTYSIVSQSLANQQKVTPAAVWLLDNDYVLQEQVQLTRSHLPKGYSRQLPRCADGVFAGLPRVYELAWELVLQVDGRLDEDDLSRFTQAYQSVSSLTIGELWAVPIMLRLALIGKVRRVAHRVAMRQTQRQEAAQWAGRFIEMAQKQPKHIVVLLGELLRSRKQFTGLFVAELASRLQGQHPAISSVLSWLEHELVERGESLEGVMHKESQDISANQVSISNCIASFRLLGAINWRQFVEMHSVVEQVLRTDPAGVYPRMDFHSRDRYRHVVEHIARRCDLSESEVARQAVDLAVNPPAPPGADSHCPVDEARISHVGWYLVDQGRATLERKTGYRPSMRRRVFRFLRSIRTALYVGTILGLTLILTGSVLLNAWWLDIGRWHLAIVGLLVLLLASQTAISLVNWLVTLLVRPRALQRMDFEAAIPPEHATAVVVPNMITSPRSVQAMVDALEVRFLANRQSNVHFVLLTDFADARSRQMPDDQPLLAKLLGLMDKLNERYGQADGRRPFHVMHRPRVWNERENAWMGHERKRGKIEAFNHFVITGEREAFSQVTPGIEQLRDTKHVIVLDADTQLPPGVAHQLAGAMAHPLNRPVLHPRTHRVVRGYGILQPKVTLSLANASKSLYSRLLTLNGGLDPYSRQVSDIYQDLFGEGSFIGKGIYDLHAFEASTRGRFPDNAILSHDLIEGCYARSGFLSDVELLEDAPTRYTADVNRRHRWIRGDWQIAPWVLPWTPCAAGGMKRNVLNVLARWKIFDNLRRSLLPLAAAMLIAMGLGVLDEPADWLAIALGLLFLPSLIRSVHVMMATSRKQPRWRILQRQAVEIVHGLLELLFMPYEALTSLGAVLKVFWRKLVSGKKLLEWQTSAAAEKSARVDLPGGLRMMWVCPVAGLALVGLGVYWLEAAPAAIPLGLCWLSAPIVAWLLSRPLPGPSDELDESQRQLLRNIARRSWHFFEVHVTAQTNWLAPDNYQQEPAAMLAQRTSPTNIGLGMLSTIAAWDLGYLTQGMAAQHIEQTLHTLGQLERYRGHFLNWYDTRTLAPLEPRYVSTVDSGNLAASLLVLGASLEEMVHKPVVDHQWVQGILDTLAVLKEEITHDASAGTMPYDPAPARAMIRQMGQIVQTCRMTRSSCEQAADRLVAIAQEVSNHIGLSGRASRWAEALADQAADVKMQLAMLPTGHELAQSDMQLLMKLLAKAEVSLDDITYFKELASRIPTLAQAATMRQRLAKIETPLQREIDASPGSQAVAAWLESVRDAGERTSSRAQARIENIQAMAQRAYRLAVMDFTFLFNSQRKQFTIGFHPDHQRLDNSYYDFLASEARIASYVAIALGQVPVEHWFMLGRRVAAAGNGMALTSWSGSMFEYLMPDLFMPTYQGTLLHESSISAVREQIKYAARRRVPWGISESGYNLVDSQLQYQYKAFGLPTLGFKRGLSDDLVIAPYAAVMAVMAMPDETVRNLREMIRLGFMGTAGFYEAVDYTPSRVPHEQRFAIVHSWMSHHTGMSLLALTSRLCDQPMQRRFMSVPQLRAMQLLLQERVPLTTPSWSSRELDARSGKEAQDVSEKSATIETYSHPNPVSPHVALLGNSQYHVLLTETGGGASHWQDLALTRWRRDRTIEYAGTIIYVRDVDRKRFWTTGYFPVDRKPAYYQAIFSQGKVEYVRVDDEIETQTEIAVSPSDDVEVRRVRVTNLSHVARIIDVTSYNEVVLARHAADMSHRTFSNLFVQSSLGSHDSLVFTRRARGEDETPPWMFHLMATGGGGWSEPTFESDRQRFLGRGRDISQPEALGAQDGLSNTTGAVLDPAACIRRRIRLRPGESAQVDIVLGAAADRPTLDMMIERYSEKRFADRIFESAWTHTQVVQQQLGVSITDVINFRRLAAAVIFGEPTLRGAGRALQANRLGQQSLWGHGISGDLPLVFVTVSDGSGLEMAAKVIKAHAWWRRKGLRCDLVILVQERGGYRQDLLSSVTGIAQASVEGSNIDKPGGIFIRNVANISDEDYQLFQACADVWLHDRAGTLQEQVARYNMPGNMPPALNLSGRNDHHELRPASLVRDDLQFHNGLGGFTQDGKEYVIRLKPGENTPLPWANVLANGAFGTVVTESGSGYTWFENAHEYRLTPWHNDPVSDPAGEALYLRDDATGESWSPTPLPRRGKGDYLCRHGLGYSVYEHQTAQLFSETTIYVAYDAPVKFHHLRLRNQSSRPRRISVWACFDWVLGELRDKTQNHIVTSVDPQTGIIMARNPYEPQTDTWTGFAGCAARDRTYTGDRLEFFGRAGSRSHPACLSRTKLSNRLGPGQDPCAAFQCVVEIPPGQEREVVFVLGAGHDEKEAIQTARHFAGLAGARRALEDVWQFWDRLLGTVRIQTPEPAMDVMLNHWIIYQAIACRLWARSGYYQSGGAYGFRDQMQDTMALLHTAPWLLREQLLTNASRQFREGDVQHWWHPPGGQGVRTHFADDYLWLPYAMARYVTATGDTGVLDEQVHFLEGRPVRPDEEAYYEQPNISHEKATLYEHGLRAIRHAHKWGQHGLPLIGCGDWNDGMNRIGVQGKGESVWMAFFLHDVCKQFEKLAQMRNDQAAIAQCQAIQKHLSRQVDKEAWDGQWYRRAYFDDGTPVGSAQSEECKIDSIAQSWAVISQAGDPDRAATAMASLWEKLVDHDLAVLRLFTPPFDKTGVDPGYIKGYLPGVRENGAQYTHAAIWAAIATGRQGDIEKLWQAFGYLNPIFHADTPEKAAIYRVEPYVIAADVYTNPQHLGRGGWTWYTGSAGWFYRLMLEEMLGVTLEWNHLAFNPRIPSHWEAYKIDYRYRSAMYHLQFKAVTGHRSRVRKVTRDGQTLPDHRLPLVDDGKEHQVLIELH